MKIPRLPTLFKSPSRDTGWLAIVPGEHGVYLAKVRLSGAMPIVVRCEYHETGTVSAAALEKLRREAHIGGHAFTTLLAPGEYQMLLVDAPNVPVNELKAAVRWRIKDALSYHVDDATVDALQIPASKGGIERPPSLYAVAVPNDIIRKRIALFEDAKIELKVIDIPEMAQRNIARLFEESERALAMLAFDEDGGLLTLTCNEELYLARRLEITSGQLQDASEDLRQQTMDRVELEVQRSLDYFDRQFNHIPVSRLLISAQSPSGLVKMLGNNLDVPVEQLDLAQVMDISAVPALSNSEFIADVLPTLGAALRHERRAL